ncbi:hypothetical protein U2P60_14775 [Brucella sp. H1_1004]|uniref:hypothetical protein n=1 Tax=Brucella sp. H1_1004 TaxID=3110109 RepID=UPI0039B37118
MHSTYQINTNLLTGALARMAKSAVKPAKKVRDYSLQAEAFRRAHEKLAAHIAFNRSRPSMRNWKPTASERRYMMSGHLKAAYAAIRFENTETPAVRTVSLEECLLIGSDSRWR